MRKKCEKSKMQIIKKFNLKNEEEYHELMKSAFVTDSKYCKGFYKWEGIFAEENY